MTPIISTLILAVAAMSLTDASAAISKSAQRHIQERYRLERAACLNGTSNQSRQTCLREADAARAQALRGDLDNGAVDHERNARRRCDVLPETLRQDCDARMRGAGTVHGDVAGGGISRDLVTTVPPAAASAPAGR